MIFPVNPIEAARIGGRHELGILNRIIMPVSATPAARLTIVMFFILWGRMPWAAVTMQGGGPRTLPLGPQKVPAYRG